MARRVALSIADSLNALGVFSLPSRTTAADGVNASILSEQSWLLAPIALGCVSFRIPTTLAQGFLVRTINLHDGLLALPFAAALWMEWHCAGCSIARFTRRHCRNISVRIMIRSIGSISGRPICVSSKRSVTQTFGCPCNRITVGRVAKSIKGGRLPVAHQTLVLQVSVRISVNRRSRARLIA
jgi:hypothetical protein